MKLFFAGLAVILFCAAALAGEPAISVGDSPPPFALEDQNGRLHTNSASWHFLVFAPDRAASQVVTETFKDQTAATLEGRGMVYVADISGMPSLVASMFALPKMRKQPYPILLGRKAEETNRLPRQTECVTVISMKDKQIDAIVFLRSSAELRKALKFE